MLPATLRDVRVITKLYFVNFKAFKESMTLKSAQRSFKVIYFVPCTILYRPLMVTFATFSTASEILPVLYAQKHFSTPIPIPAKYEVFGTTERRKARLISREINYQEFQLCDHDTSMSQTDGQTDNLPQQYTALCVASRSKNDHRFPSTNQWFKLISAHL